MIYEERIQNMMLIQVIKCQTNQRTTRKHCSFVPRAASLS